MRQGRDPRKVGEGEKAMRAREARGAGAGSGGVRPSSPGAASGAAGGRQGPGGAGWVAAGGSGRCSRGTAGRFILCIGNSARHVSCST